jgi:predicted nucleic acid-binding protein
MIAADTSVLIHYFQGSDHPSAEKLDKILNHHALVLPGPVMSELLSDPGLSPDFINKIEQLPVLSLSEGFWQRAGLMRAKLISKKYKARLADTLIAQSCIDHDVPLITCDADFRHFAKYFGLLLSE